MDKVFSLRLDYESRQRLQQLADGSFRTRAGVIRYLLHLATQNPNLIIPYNGNTEVDSSTNHLKRVNNSNQGVLK